MFAGAHTFQHTPETLGSCKWVNGEVSMFLLGRYLERDFGLKSERDRRADAKGACMMKTGEGSQLKR